MTIEEFWTLMHRSSAETTSKDERTKWLTIHLAQQPIPEIIAFELHLAAQRSRVDTHLMWGAAWHIMQGWCSEDSFWYFQPWLVGLGRDAFEEAAQNPDALAGNPQVRRLAGRPRSDWSDDEWPEWELLNYVALNAHELATGHEDGFDDALEAQGLHRVCNPYPADKPWDYDDARQRRVRLPDLSELLP